MLRMVLQALNQTALYSVGRSMGGGGKGVPPAVKYFNFLNRSKRELKTFVRLPKIKNLSPT